MNQADGRDWVFAKARIAKIGIVTASGAPLVAPVWVARDGDGLVFNTVPIPPKGSDWARSPPPSSSAR